MLTTNCQLKIVPLYFFTCFALREKLCRSAEWNFRENKMWYDDSRLWKWSFYSFEDEIFFIHWVS